VYSLPLLTARFARGAECAEIIIFSFAVERTANENHSAASLQKKQNIGASNKLGGRSSLPAGPDDFSFSASQRKAKK
jgi:hypothetical protein